MPIVSSAVRHRMRTPVLMCALLLGALLPSVAGAQEHAHGAHARRDAKHQYRHPAPRPGITAERVLPADSVPESAREVYTMAARIPSILDGLYCHCDCHERDELRSLLECFENAMASTCGICQSEARMAYEMARDGRSLRDIRKAVDAEYGG